MAPAAAALTSSRRERVAPRGGGRSPSSSGPKNLGLVGARRRQWGRWAAELRVPRTRERLWIGTFATPKEAAHAYDAALFCFYGARVPKARRLNFPAAPRPNVPEHARVGLTIANIKAIAEKYARSLADYVVPPPPPTPVIPAAPPPTPVVGGAAACSAGAPAAAAIAGVDVDVVTIADWLLSFNANDFDEMVARI
ncbi:hypothetical protein EJB05_55503, partial [Eragrostis curvula]